MLVDDAEDAWDAWVVANVIFIIFKYTVPVCTTLVVV